MNIKSVVMIMMCSLIGQSVMAARLLVGNKVNQTLIVTILWNGGQKEEILYPLEKKYLSSGHNPIHRVTWVKRTDGKILPGEMKYRADLLINDPVSLSHKIFIGFDGLYNYDGQYGVASQFTSERAVADPRGLLGPVK